MKKFLAVLAFLTASICHADSTTNRLHLILPTVGSPTWGQKVNGNFQIIDATIAALGAPNTINSSTTFKGYVQFTSTVNWQNLKFGTGQCLGINASSDTIIIACGSGGMSTLDIHVNGVQISSPTSSIAFSSAFLGTQSPAGTSNIGLNPSSATVQGRLVAGSNITITPGAGVTTIAATGGGTPGGSNSNVQINQTGSFYGDNGFQYDSSISTVTIAGEVGSITSDSRVILNKISSSDPYIIVDDLNGSPGGGIRFQYGGTDRVIFYDGSGLGIQVSTASSSAPTNRISFPINSQKTLISGPASTIIEFDPIGNSSFTIPVYLSTITINRRLIDSTGSIGSLNQVFTVGSSGDIWQNSNSGGGGMSPLAVGTGNSTSFTTIVTSPTAAINLESNQFLSVFQSGDTNYIALNASSVTLQGQNVLSLSSASATYFNKLSPYISSINVTSLLTVTGNGTAGSTPQIGLAATSVSPGSYTNTNLTVDTQGRITTASNGSSGSSGGGYAVQPATVTFQLNQGVTASTITASTVTVTGYVQSPIFRLYGNSGAQLSQLFTHAIRVTVGSIPNTDFSDSTLSNIDNVVYGRTTAAYQPQGDFNMNGFAVNTAPPALLQSLEPWGAYSASINGDGLGLNQVYFGARAKIGEDTFFAIAPGTNTNCGANCFTNNPSTPIFVIDTKLGSSNYGNVGIGLGISTPTATLSVVGDIKTSTNAAHPPPSLGTCEISPSLSVGATDTSGVITIGTGSGTACALNFGTTKSKIPACVISGNSTSIALGITTTTSGFTLTTPVSIASDVVAYICMGNE